MDSSGFHIQKVTFHAYLEKFTTNTNKETNKQVCDVDFSVLFISTIEDQPNLVININQLQKHRSKECTYTIMRSIRLSILHRCSLFRR